MINLRPFTLASLLAGLALTTLNAQQTSAPAAEPSQAEMEARQKAILDKIESFGWTREGIGKLGSRAQVAIPKGYRFTDGNGTREMMKLTDNFPTQKELGMLTTEGLGHWIIFEFDESGYVKDDEKDKLDADELLKVRKEGQEAANAKRREAGMEELHVLGWAVPPRFNDQTKNLEWALRIGSTSGESINYETRLLGRYGVTEVTLVCSPEEMNGLLGDYQAIMSSFEYVDGERYAQFDSSKDKIAKYGLTGLVAGTGAFAAAKMGLFAKLGGLLAKMGKFVIVLVVGVLAGLKALFSKLFGRRTA
ncbi:MAG TPA: DUF2167 domain-containing protein [Prosthecobacter sp.]|nr:DUF2167 domain-containing protein [Prosthecobacter sp.]